MPGPKMVGAFHCIVKGAAGMATLDPNDDGERCGIVNTGPVAAEDGQVGQVAYKAAMKGMTLVIARDLVNEGIRINSILPGIMAPPAMLNVNKRAPAIFDSLSPSEPLPRRLGHPHEYADLAVRMLRNGDFNDETVRLDGAI